MIRVPCDSVESISLALALFILASLTFSTSSAPIDMIVSLFGMIVMIFAIMTSIVTITCDFRAVRTFDMAEVREADLATAPIRVIDDNRTLGYDFVCGEVPARRMISHSLSVSDWYVSPRLKLRLDRSLTPA